MRTSREVSAHSEEQQSQQLVQKWADGKATLKDVRGYSPEELYSLARTAYVFYHQGRLDEARILFQGLYALDPMDAYFARALGVVEFAAGNPQGAVAAYDVAIKLSPEDAAGYVGRAEVRLAQGQKALAVEDLRRALTLCRVEDSLKAKVSGMLALLVRK